MGTEIEVAGLGDRQLKACLSDLLSVLAIPAISSGGDSRHVVSTLLDVLLGLLRLDFAYAHFKEATERKPVTLARIAGLPKSAVLPRRLRHTIEGWLAEGSHASPLMAPSLSGHGGISILTLRLGLHDDIGWVAVGSERTDFPTQSEKLVLGVAANQAAIGVQEARLISKQKRLVQELERKVAERNRDLQTANTELNRALREIHALKDGLQRENLRLRELAASTRGGLAPWQLRRAKLLMTTQLGAHVPLGRIAEECGLSLRHFARAFRQSSGVPPHRWLLNRRVERAKELLRDPLLSLADVGLACGFADQSHFTRVFTAAVCLSPGMWRRLQSAQLRPAKGSAAESKNDTWIAQRWHRAVEARKSRADQGR